MREWFRNVWVAVSTVLKGLWVTIATMFKTYRRKPFAEGNMRIGIARRNVADRPLQDVAGTAGLVRGRSACARANPRRGDSRRHALSRDLGVRGAAGVGVPGLGESCAFGRRSSK